MLLANNKTATVIPALERGLDVLEHISTVDTPLTLTAIARSCGRSVSELQRVVACLHRRGYLFRDAGGAYRVSSKLFQMGQACPPFQDVLTRSRVPMRVFAHRSGEAVHLSVMAEDRLLILANVPGPGYLQLGVNVGTLHDPMLSPSGRVLLAAMSAVDLAAYTKRTGIAASQVKSLDRHLARIRGRGYECVESPLYHGIYDLAVGVTAPGGECIAAVACSFLRSRDSSAGGRAMAVQSLLPKLRSCSRQITAALEPARHHHEKEIMS